jgi:hypothetical protein
MEEKKWLSNVLLELVELYDMTTSLFIQTVVFSCREFGSSQQKKDGLMALHELLQVCSSFLKTACSKSAATTEPLFAPPGPQGGPQKPL